ARRARFDASSVSASPPFPPTLPQPSAEPFVEPLEYGGRVGQCEVGRPAGRVAIDQPDPLLDRDAPAARGQPSQSLLGALKRFRVDPHADRAVASPVETEAEQRS